jgi:hypothetical protein
MDANIDVEDIIFYSTVGSQMAVTNKYVESSKADSLTAQKMWEHRRLKTLWDSTACYRITT